MLIVNKKGVNYGFDVDQAKSVGVNIHYLIEETTEGELVVEVAGISKGEARRQIKQGSVWLGNERCTSFEEIMPLGGNAAMTLFIGKELKGVIVPFNVGL